MITSRALDQLKQNLPEGYVLRVTGVHDGQGVSGTVVSVGLKVMVLTDDGLTITDMSPWNMTNIDMVHEQEDDQYCWTSGDFQIMIKTGTTAFVDRNGETARILREVATRLDDDESVGIIRDGNDKIVGSYRFRMEDTLP